MAYIDTVLALNPTLHYKCDEAAGTTVVDATGNGNHGTYTGTFALQARKIVRSSLSEPEFGAVDLGNGSAGTGTGVISCPTLDLDNKSYTTAGWVRYRGVGDNLFFSSSSFNYIHHQFNLASLNDIVIDHRNVGSVLSTANAARSYSRHFVVFRYDASITTGSIWLDGQLIVSGVLNPATSAVGNTVFGGFSVGTNNWKQIMQHLSIWVGVAISDADIESLWLAGRDRPFYAPTLVDFDEPEYVLDTEPATTLWNEAFNTNCEHFVREDLTASGNRILESTAPFGERYGYRWIEGKEEPKQKLHTRMRLVGGTLHGGIILLAGSAFNGSFGAGISSFIHVGVESNIFFIKQYIFGSLTTLASTAFAYVTGDWLQIRAEVDSFTLEIRAKVWKDVDPEPVDWIFDINTMHQKFQYGDGFVGIHNHVGNPNTMRVDYLNVESNVGPPVQPTLIAVVDEDSNTELTGSAYDGGLPFLNSILTIKRYHDQSIVVDELTTPVTDWTYLAETLPYNTVLEARIIYVDTDLQESTPSRWISFIIPDPNALPITECDLTIPVFADEEGEGSGEECGGIPVPFEPCP